MCELCVCVSERERERERFCVLFLDEILINKYATLILINLSTKKASQRQESHGDPQSKFGTIL